MALTFLPDIRVNDIDDFILYVFRVFPGLDVLIQCTVFLPQYTRIRTRLFAVPIQHFKFRMSFLTNISDAFMKFQTLELSF